MWVFSCYSPTNYSDETDITLFYNELLSLAQHILKCNIVIITAIMLFYKNKKAMLPSPDVDTNFFNIVKDENYKILADTTWQIEIPNIQQIVHSRTD